MAHSPIYLDNNATTPIAPQALEAMLPALRESYGNASSSHRLGAAAAGAVETARSQVARLIGARPGEIVFTSGGTEADNLALRGVLEALPRKRHIVISTVEHHAVLEPAQRLEQDGVRVTCVGVNAGGELDLEKLTSAIEPDTALVSIMLANNETGVIGPLERVCEIAHRRGALVHSDAVNAVGKMPVNVDALGLDLLSLSAHKLHGPKGSGGLFVRKGVALKSLIIGGPQENHRRGGTLNVAGIVGLGAACELAAGMDEPARRGIAELRDALEARLLETCGPARVIGAQAERLCNTSCVCFEGASAEALVILLSEAGVCVSSGAACSSGATEPSHVLAALGVDGKLARGQIRFSLSRYSTSEEIDRALEMMPPLVDRARRV